MDPIVEWSQTLRHYLCDNLGMTWPGAGAQGMDQALEKLWHYLRFGQKDVSFMERRFLTCLEEWHGQMRDNKMFYNNGITIHHEMPSAEQLWGIFCYYRHCRPESEAGGGILGACLVAAFMQGGAKEAEYSFEEAMLPYSLVLHDLHTFGAGRLSIRQDPVLYLYLMAEAIYVLKRKDPGRSARIRRGYVLLEAGRTEAAESFLAEAQRQFSRLEVGKSITKDGALKLTVPM
ncbi:MAG: hypothetical protein K6E18_06065 [Lachnospiraceae bacterium]|nr:hypothetical protein [Lachnospiraceae bacterium]